jgi:GGDEF domain-containing protein
MPVAQRLLAAIEAPLVIDGHSLQIAASIGIAAASDKLHSADELLHRADRAMYRAKSQVGGATIFEKDR